MRHTSDTVVLLMPDEVDSKDFVQLIMESDQRIRTHSNYQCVWCDSWKVQKLTDAVIAPWVFATQDLLSPMLNTELLFCADCELQYFAKRYGPSELEFLYKDYRGSTYLQRRQRWEPWYSTKRNCDIGSDLETERLRKCTVGNFILPFLGEGRKLRIVDYGGDEGQFIPSFLHTEFTGVFDISGKNLRDGVVCLRTAGEVREVSPNLILLCHVLEHLVNPRVEFENVIELLESDGLLYVEVPLDFYRIKSGTPQRLLNAYRSSRFMFILADFVSQICRFRFKSWSRFRLTKQSEHLQFFTLKCLMTSTTSLGLQTLDSFTYRSNAAVGTPTSLGVLFRKL